MHGPLHRLMCYMVDTLFSWLMHHRVQQHRRKHGEGRGDCHCRCTWVNTSLHAVDASLHAVDVSLHAVDASLHVVDASLHAVDASLHAVDASLHVVDASSPPMHGACD